MDIRRHKILRSVTFSLSDNKELIPWATMHYIVEFWDGEKLLSYNACHEQVESEKAKSELQDIPVMGGIDGKAF